MRVACYTFAYNTYINITVLELSPLNCVSRHSLRKRGTRGKKSSPTGEVVKIKYRVNWCWSVYEKLAFVSLVSQRKWNGIACGVGQAR